MDRQKKIANVEELLIGMISMLALGMICGYVIGINLEYFGSKYIKTCIQNQFMQ